MQSFKMLSLSLEKKIVQGVWLIMTNLSMLNLLSQIDFKIQQDG